MCLGKFNGASITMKLIKFIIEKTNTGYSGYAELSGGHIAATTGSNLTELKINALESVNALLDHLHRKQITIDKIQLCLDIPQFFDFYKVINASALAIRLKISNKLLSQYISGNKKPSAERVRAILQGVNDLGRELASIEFV
jgi:transcriptional regulator with XRE-family HTH domain